MPTYLVTIPEIHERLIKIDAATSEEAVSLVGQGQGIQVAINYSKTFTQEQWMTEEVHEDREDL
jgi:hypothetical protein